MDEGLDRGSTSVCVLGVGSNESAIQRTHTHTRSSLTHTSQYMLYATLIMHTCS